MVSDGIEPPDEIFAAARRGHEGMDAATRWLSEHGHEINEATADAMVAWAERIVRMVGREPVPERRPVAEIRARARQEQLEFGPSTIPQAGRAPTIEVDKQADRVRLVFELSLAQFWALEAAGRKDALSRNVQDIHLPPGVPWEDERCARYAIQRAMTLAYPEIVGAPNIRDEETK